MSTSSGRTRLRTPGYGFLSQFGATNTLKDIDDSRCIGTVGSGQGCVLQSYTVALQVCDGTPTCGGFVCWDEAGLVADSVSFNATNPLEWTKQCFVFVKPLQLVGTIRQNAYIKIGEEVIAPNSSVVIPFPIATSTSVRTSTRATSVTSSAPTSSSSVTQSQASTGGSTSNSTTPIGIIIGAAVGASAFLAVIAVVAFFFFRKRQQEKQAVNNAGMYHTSPPNSPPSASAPGKLPFVAPSPAAPAAMHKFEPQEAGSSQYMMASGTAMGGSSQAKPYEYQNGGMQETKGGGLFAAAGSPAFAPPPSAATTLHPQMWSSMDTLSWLYSRGISAEIIAVFEQNNLTGSDLLSLDAYRLSLLGLHESPAVLKLLQEIRVLQSVWSGERSTGPALPAYEQPPAGPAGPAYGDDVKRPFYS